MTVSHKESREGIIKLNRTGDRNVEIKVSGQFCFQGDKQICLHNVTTDTSIIHKND